MIKTPSGVVAMTVERCRRWLPAVLLAAACAFAAGPFAAAAPAPQGADDAVPRWPDGRVNLGSAPGSVGYWEIRPGGNRAHPRATPAAEVPFQPWARALFEERQAGFGITSPLVNCKPVGGPSFFNAPGFEIVDVPELEAIFLLNIAGPHSWRIVHLDGRGHPEDLRPTYLGHSIGRWEGDTLVVDTVGFNEKIWITGSYPSTRRLHLIERFTRHDRRTLEYEFTVDDPGAYEGPWSGGWIIDAGTASSWIDDGEMFEYICQDDR